MIEQSMNNLKPVLSNKTRPPFGEVLNYEQASFALQEAILESALGATNENNSNCNHCQKTNKVLISLKLFLDSQ